MPKFYVVKDIGGGFDGLTVEGEVFDDYPHFVSVTKLTDRDSIVGDRNVSLPVPAHSLLIALKNLDEIEDPGTREFSSENPYGKFLLQGTMQLGGTGDSSIQIAYSQYEKALQVSVTNVIPNGIGGATRNTLLNQNYSKDFDKIKLAIEDVLKENGEDPDDLIFKLKALKEAESNGQKEQG